MPPNSVAVVDKPNSTGNCRDNRHGYGHIFPSALTACLALRIIAENPPRNRVSEKRVNIDPSQVDGRLAGGEGHAAMVRLSRHPARKAEMGNGTFMILIFDFGAPFLRLPWPDSVLFPLRR